MRLLLCSFAILLLTQNIKCSTSANAQTPLVDSILSFINTGKLMQAKNLFGQLEQQTQKNPNNSASLYYIKARLLQKEDNTVAAMNLLRKAEQLSIANHDTVLLHRCLLSRELIFTEQGYNDSAAAICYRRLELNRIRHNYLALSDNFRALSSLLATHLNSHSASGLMDSCLHYALLSKDPKGITVSLTNYGLYVYGQDQQKGLKYLYAAIDSSNRTPNDLVYIYARIQTAEVLIESGNCRKAESLLLEALQKCIVENEFTQRAHIYLALGRIDMLEHNSADAIKHLQLARNIAENKPLRYYLTDIYETLSQAFQSAKQFDSSLVYSRKAAAMQHQLINESTTRQVAEVNAKYQLKAKESTITKMGNKLGSYRKVLISLFISLFGLVTFFALYLVRININRSDENFQPDSSKPCAKKSTISLPTQFKKEFEKEFIRNEAFTQSNLTLQKLADILHTNTTYLSRFINEEYKCSFPQLLNHYRVEKACQLLLNSKMEKLTIEAIAQAAGFHSKSTFNTAFRNQKGLTPTDWKASSVLISPPAN